MSHLRLSRRRRRRAGEPAEPRDRRTAARLRPAGGHRREEPPAARRRRGRWWSRRPAARPTGDMVYDPHVRHPDEAGDARRLRGRRPRRRHSVRCARGRRGAVRQHRRRRTSCWSARRSRPVRCRIPAASIEQAIELNGVAVAANLARVPVGPGRRRRPGRVRRRPTEAGDRAPGRRPRRRAASWRAARSPVRPGGWRRCARRDGRPPGRARRPRYVDLVERAWHAERAVGDRHRVQRGGRAGALTGSARTRTSTRWRGCSPTPVLEADVLAQVPGATTLTYHLHPPALRSAGLGRKIAARPVVPAGALGAGPGTACCAARRWIPSARPASAGWSARWPPTTPSWSNGWRRRWTPADLQRAVAVAESAELVRGYEGVKVAAVQRYRRRREELGEPLGEAVVRWLPGPS